MDYDRIAERLMQVLSELREQPHVGRDFPSDLLPFEQWLDQLNEWISEVDEFGLAYESIIAGLESHPFAISGKSAIALIEIALTFGFKTDRIEDSAYDKRP